MDRKSLDFAFAIPLRLERRKASEKKGQPKSDFTLLLDREKRHVISLAASVCPKHLEIVAGAKRKADDQLITSKVELVKWTHAKIDKEK